MYRSINREKILGVLAVIFLLLGTANALEYFFAGKGHLAVYKGVVTEIEHNTYQGMRDRMYAETRVSLEGSNRQFSIYEFASVGGYLEAEPGDTITLYVRHRYQYLYNYSLKTNIYYAEKAGKQLYNNMSEWRRTSFAFMCYLGGMGLFLLIIVFDITRGNRIRNRIKRRILNI